MAAAYAAVVSLMNTIDQIQHHRRPPISLDKQQIESLTEKVTFLQKFLESYSLRVGYNKEADALESRIADAAYAAEDIIESHIANRILSRSIRALKIFRFICFYQGLQKVIEDMDLIKKKVIEIKEKTEVQYQLHRNLTHAGSLRSSSTGPNIMVGFDDVLHDIMDKLIGQQSGLQIIPIVGMGGIGKTTLARNIYVKPLIKEYFDISAWATISQECNTREILREVLCQVNKDGGGYSSEMSENQLGERLYKHLSGRRYLIVMDDLWSIEAWDKVKIFFPDYMNGSRIVVTTRLSNLAFQLSNSYCLDMKFLDEDSSWNLFSKIVFEEEGCPIELKYIGKKIVKNCKGLPLSIIVIGGLLAKSERTEEHWGYISRNLNSIVNLEDNERGLQILYMSYNNLPVYLKPCFLYMGVFKEDSKIRASELIKLWSAEGFLKPLDDRSLTDATGVSNPHSFGEKRSLEKAGEEYLQELVDRNLILVEECNYNGKVKFCKIHDLLRDLCLREARKMKFFGVLGEQSTLNIPQYINTERRICFRETTQWERDPFAVLHAFQPLSVTRSWLWEHKECKLPSFLRVYSTFAPDRYPENRISSQVNLRYLALRAHETSSSGILSSISLLWNLQTVIVESFEPITAPAAIWKMHQLRHVKIRHLTLPDPPTNDTVVLENLQTLAAVRDFKCGEEVVNRIPNIKKLKVEYRSLENLRTLAAVKYFKCGEEVVKRMKLKVEYCIGSPDNPCINNLGHLNKLESLSIFFICGRSQLLQNLTIPETLKKLTLEGFDDCNWDDLLARIGSLPLLEKLRIRRGSFKGCKWETVEEQFRSLKFLTIGNCCSLEYWATESSHFPCLKYLVLGGLYKLKEIPSEIGEIPTLKSIRLQGCSHYAVMSAKKILAEQEELGNTGLQLIIH